MTADLRHRSTGARIVLAAAWDLARRRLTSDPLALSAIALVVLLATTLLSAGPLYTTSVTEAGLQRRLATAPPSDVGIEIVLRSPATAVATLDPAVRSLLDGALGDAVATVDAITESDSVRGELGSDATITSFAVVGIDDLLTTTAHAPTGDDGIPVAVHEEALGTGGLALGQVLDLELRDGSTVRVRVARSVVPADPTDRRWWDQPLVRDGVVVGTSFTRVGPLMVEDADAFGRIVGDARVDSRWRVQLDPGAVSTATLPSVRRGVQDVVEAAEELPDVGSVEVRTDLDGLLATTVDELRATRASVTVTALQLALLALYTLALVANLVVDTRSVETTLVRARGATPAQLGIAAALEGAALALPAIVLGPLLAAQTLRVLDGTGVLADVGLVLAPRLTLTAFLAAAAAGIAAIVVLVVPAARAARSTFAGTRAARARVDRASFAQRSGADIALLLVAVAGLWQLRRAGSAITENATGAADIDPLLVVAPALGLLAGSVLVLRLVPVLARVAIRVTTSGRGFVGSLSAWQIGRRPARTSRALLLLVLSVAIGTFAASYSVTWSTSQREQAMAETGADLSVAPDARIGAARSAAVLGAGFTSVEGVRSAVPAWTSRASVGGSSAALVSLDLADPEVIARRDDVAVGIGVLHDPAEVVGLPIAGERPDRIEVDVTATAGRPDRDLALIVTIRDADGLIHQVLSDEAPIDRSRTVTIPLADEGEGRRLDVRGPVEVLGIELVTTPVLLPPGPLADAPSSTELGIDVVLGQFRVVGPDGEVPIDVSPVEDWAAVVERQVVGAVPPVLLAVRVTASTIALQGTIGASVSAGRTGYRFAPGDAGVLADVPAAVTPALLATSGLAVGDVFAIDVSGADVPLRIDRVVDVVPTRPDEERAILVDVATLATQRYLRGGGITIPTDWLLRVDDDARAAAAATIAAPPFRAAAVVDVEERTRERRSDPVAVGLIGALTAGLVGAALLAGIGYLVTAVVSARQRIGEFALLRAMGVSAGETRRWLAIESIVTVGGGILAGLLLGVTLASVILPAVTMSQDGLPAVPTPRLVIPWAVISATVAAAGVLLLVVPIALSAILERTRVAEVLRLGADA